MKKILVMFALCMMCSAMPAHAMDDNTMDKGDMKTHAIKKADYYMMKMDTNKDGRVSESEHDAFAKQMFNDADTNGDKMLSSDELAAAKMKEKQEMKADMGTMKHTEKMMDSEKK